VRFLAGGTLVKLEITSWVAYSLRFLQKVDRSSIRFAIRRSTGANGDASRRLYGIWVSGGKEGPLNIEIREVDKPASETRALETNHSAGHCWVFWRMKSSSIGRCAAIT
jgi:hypothetical protein